MEATSFKDELDPAPVRHMLFSYHVPDGEGGARIVDMNKSGGN